MGSLKCTLIGVIAVVFAVMPPARAETWPQQDYVFVRATGCDNVCPVMEFFVGADGRALFVGERLTSGSGVYSADLGARAFADFRDTIATHHPHRLPADAASAEACEGWVEGNAGYVLRFRLEGEERAIAFNRGCEGGMHGPLANLFDDLLRLIEAHDAPL